MSVCVWFLVLMWLCAGLQAADAPFTSFVVQSVSGQVNAQEPTAPAPEPATVRTAYPFGTRIQTDRNATAVLELTPGNTVRVLPKADILITSDARHPKLVVLKLEEGGLHVKLDKFPKNHAMQVRMPIGICGVVGTEFSVFYRVMEGGSVNVGVACTQGEVRFDSTLVSIPAIPAGVEMSMQATEGNVSRTVEITVNQPTRIALGLSNEVWLGPGTTIRVAMQNVDGPTSFVAVQVLQGQARIGTGEAQQTLTAAGAPVFVSGDRTVAPPEGGASAAAYMNAAVRESTAAAAIRAAEAAGLPIEPALRQEQAAAARVLQQQTPEIPPPLHRPPYVPPELPVPALSPVHP